MKKIALEYAIPLLILAVVVFWIMQQLTPFGAAVTPDSLAYMEMARNLADGHGLSLSNYSIENRNDYYTVTVWPPLYPAVLSLLVVNADTAVMPMVSAGLGTFLLLVCSMLWFFGFKKQFKNSQISVFLTILICLSLPVITIFTHAWSEVLFVPLLLTSILVASYIVDKKSKVHPVLYIGLALLLAAVFYVRYIGIIFSLIFLLIFAIERKRINKAWFGVSVLAYIAFALALVLRNYMLNQSISGAERGSGSSIEEISLNFYYTALTMFNPYSLVGAALISAVVIFLHKKQQAANEILIDKSDSCFAKITAASAGLYMAGLIAMSYMAHFDNIDMRLTSPFWILISTSIIIWLISGLCYNNYMRSFFCGVFIICMVMVGIKKIFTIGMDWKVSGTPFINANFNVFYNNFNNLKMIDAVRYTIKEANKKYDFILTDRPMNCEFVFGIDSFNVPSGKISREWLAAVKKHKHGLMVLQNRANEMLAFIEKHPEIKINFHPDLIKVGFMVIDIEDGVLLPVPESGIDVNH